MGEIETLIDKVLYKRDLSPEEQLVISIACMELLRNFYGDEEQKRILIRKYPRLATAMKKIHNR